MMRRAEMAEESIAGTEPREPQTRLRTGEGGRAVERGFENVRFSSAEDAPRRWRVRA